jgi:hypothetical protein
MSAHQLGPVGDTGWHPAPPWTASLGRHRRTAWSDTPLGLVTALVWLASASSLMVAVGAVFGWVTP